MLMKSRTWFLVSVMLFIAAAFFWRKAEERRLNRPTPSANVGSKTAKKQSSVEVPNPAVVKSASARKALDSRTNSVTETNSKALYPNRLSNTSQTVGQMARNERGILLRNALIDTGSSSVKI